MVVLVLIRKSLKDVGSNYFFWSVILTDFLLKKDENYYPEVFLKERNTLKNKIL